MAIVNVSTAPMRRERKLPVGFARMVPHRAEERRQRNLHSSGDEGAFAGAKIERLQVWVGEILWKQAKLGEESRPAPLAGDELEDLNLKSVPWLSAVDVDRPGEVYIVSQSNVTCSIRAPSRTCP